MVEEGTARQVGQAERRGRRSRAAAAGPAPEVLAAPRAPAGPFTLYLVATPIGNMEDITVRALRVLREARLIAAEDTRHTARLLARYGITTPTMSYHEHSKVARLGAILAALAEGDVALVSDAGTPGLSDPGYELIGAAIERGIGVVPVPGASALLAAVAVSGLVPGPFTFFGFPPRQVSARREILERAATLAHPTVWFEAPHRLLATLQALREACGDRQVAVARELTKFHEEIRRETIGAALEHFTSTAPRGEFVLVVAGRAEAPDAVSADEALAAVRAHLEAGLAPAAAAKNAARQTGRSRDELYALAVTLRQTAARPGDG